MIRKRAPRLKTLLTIFPILIASASSSHAETLDEILDLVKNPKRQQKELKSNDPFIPRNTSLEKIFAGSGNGILIALDWMGDYYRNEFTRTKKTYRKNDEFNRLTATYRTKDKKSEVIATLLVPHPKHYDLLEVGLITAFLELEPPSLDIIASEKMEIENHEAYFYHHRAGDCSLLYKLPRHAVLNMNNPKCADSKAMVNLAKLLSIDRLKEMLAQ